MIGPEVIVTVNHLYSIPAYAGRRGFCGRGSRTWFASHHLSWPAFVREGIPGSVLLATGDALAARLVAHAQEEISHGR